MAKAPKFGNPANIIPSLLSWRRSVDVSDGHLYSVSKDGSLLPVRVEEVTVRGPTAYAAAGEKGETRKPNIQTIDRAMLDNQSETLALVFSVAMHAANRTPDACSGTDFREALSGFVAAADAAGIYEQLAVRYLWNLVNGRVLWRNGYGIARNVTLASEGVQYEIKDWRRVPQNTFPGADEVMALTGCDLSLLVTNIASALRGSRGILAIDVDIRVSSYRNAEVWPSQEFVEKEGKKRGGREISRFLSSRTVTEDGERYRHGTMHSQKIGNAIRTVDEWHGAEGKGAIPVEAYGWVQGDLDVLREHGDGKDFFALLRRLPEISADVAGHRELAMFVLAMLIRGGVYGEKKE